MLSVAPAYGSDCTDEQMRCELVCSAYRKTLLSNIDLGKAVEATSGRNAWTPFGHFHLSECSELQQREEPPPVLTYLSKVETQRSVLRLLVYVPSQVESSSIGIK